MNEAFFVVLKCGGMMKVIISYSSMETVPFEAILNQARLAPSGDNIQPWLVKIASDHELWIFKNQPDFISPSDYFRGGLYNGIGAFIEAIVIAASQHGWLVSVAYTEAIGPETEHLASLSFAQLLDPADAIAERDLFLALPDRRTNRRRYARGVLEESVMQSMQESATALGGKVTFVDDPVVLRRLSKAFSKHDDFFWTSDEGPREDLVKLVHRSRSASAPNFGMPLDTLGLGWKGFFLPLAFRIAYHIPWLWKLIGWQSKCVSEDLMQHSGALVLITLPKRREKNIFEPGYQFQDDMDGGRIMLRLWLFATTLGLSVQPTYALVAQLQNEGNAREGDYFLSLNREVVAELTSMVPELEHETLVFAFRIGKSLTDTPVPSSPRKSIEEILWSTKA